MLHPQDTKNPATGMTPREAAERLVSPGVVDSLLADAFKAGVMMTFGTSPRPRATLHTYHAARQAAAEKLAEAAREAMVGFAFNHLDRFRRLREASAAYDQFSLAEPATAEGSAI